MGKQKVKPPKIYKGSMTFPLVGANDHVHFLRLCSYNGDFIDERKRQQIFKRPRHFTVEIHLKIQGADEWDIRELTTPNDKLDKFMLSQLMHTYAVEGIKELSEYANIAIDESFFKVIL